MYQSIRIRRSGSPRQAWRGQVRFVNVQLIIVKMDGSGEYAAFDKMSGATHEGIWSVDDDLDALHRLLSIK